MRHLVTRWALGWAWWGKAPTPFRGDFPGVPDVPLGLAFEADASDGVGAVVLQDVALRLVRGAGLVELRFGVPLHPDLHPIVWAPALEAVFDRALTPDPVSRVVVVVGLLDSRARLELWVCFQLLGCLWWEGG